MKAWDDLWFALQELQVAVRKCVDSSEEMRKVWARIVPSEMVGTHKVPICLSCGEGLLGTVDSICGSCAGEGPKQNDD